MNIFKRILAVTLSVCMLTLTVGSVYFDSTHMDNVEAAELVVGAGLTASTIFQICLFFGAAVGTCYLVGEIIDNQEEIAHAGKNFIDTITEIPEGWLFNITDASTGQDYVFGSEALELVQDTSWEVIQGGSPDNNDNNDDDNNDDDKNWINLFSSANQYVGNFLSLGATWFISHASDIYHKWVNGDELTEAEQTFLEPFISGYCNQYDVASQWSGTAFDYSLNIKHSFNTVVSNSTNHYDYDLDMTSSFSVPLACHYYYSLINGNQPAYIFEILQLLNNRVCGVKILVKSSTVSNNGATPVTYPYSGRDTHVFYIYDNYENFSLSYNANFPVFANRVDAENYLRGMGDVTAALNYAHVWQNADWLSDDWRGLLIDPFTNIGLTLSQLIALAKALGLNAVGNNLSPEELVDLIKKSLPEVNPELLPDENPVTIPTPADDPIYYPTPDAHPMPTNPDPWVTPDPDPGTDPGTVTETIDIDDIVPDAASDFTDITGTLKTKFPFSLPWDIHYLFTVLADTPKTPVYYLPLVIERLGINEVIVIDMSDFEDISKLSRAMWSLLYAYGLINWTVKIVSVRKEE